MVTIGELSFSTQINLSGFRVISSVSADKINCSELSNDVYQMAIILYPAEHFNEKFLIKIRDCVLKLPEGHPIKRWLHFVSKTLPPTEEEVRAQAFLSEIINSQFNIVTEPKVRNRIIEIITDIGDKTIAEKILKSFLYLMIGNVTRSDNILSEVMKKNPFEGWKGFSLRSSFYHRFAEANMEHILQKFSKHPADRRVLQLFARYLKVYFNDKVLIDYLADFDDSSLDERLDLKSIEKTAPEFVRFLRVLRMSDKRRRLRLSEEARFPLKEQMYWYWPFIDYQPNVSPQLFSTLRELEEKDPLWFIYVMENERLLDSYVKNTGRSFMNGRRKFLRESLKDRDMFMLSLFKLIQFGDMDHTLVQEIVSFLTHE